MASRDGNAVAGRRARRAGNAGADRGDAGVEQKRTAVSGRWRALTSNWREVTRYDPPFHLDVSVDLHLKAVGTRAKMEEHKKRLQTLLLGSEDFELIAKLAKLLPVIRMAEQVRAMTADLKADIAAKRDCRSAHRPS